MGPPLGPVSGPHLRRHRQAVDLAGSLLLAWVARLQTLELSRLTRFLGSLGAQPLPQAPAVATSPTLLWTLLKGSGYGSGEP